MGDVGPLIPPAKRGGNRRHVEVREVVNGLMYVLSTGCQWRAVPKDLPPRSTLYDYFDLWGWDGTLERIHEALYVKCREAAAREASPTAAIIDSQSVKSAEKGGAHRPSGLRRGQKDQRQEAPHPGRYARPADARPSIPPMFKTVTAALLMAGLFGAFPFMMRLFADGGYQGPNSSTRSGAPLQP